MFMKRFLSICAAFIAVFLFASCSEYAKKEVSSYSTGQILSPDDISVILSELKPDEEEPCKIDENTVYYWTEDGSKFHVFSDCQSFSRTPDTDVISGKSSNIPEKIAKEPCSFCLKRASLSKEELLDIFSS